MNIKQHLGEGGIWIEREWRGEPIRQSKTRKLRKIIPSASHRSIKEWELSQCWEGKDSAIIFNWKGWQCAIFPVGFTLGWCPDWTIIIIFMSQCRQLYFTAMNRVSLATMYTDLIHSVSSKNGKQVCVTRQLWRPEWVYNTGQSLPPKWASGN